jgi:hypothetical protein
MATPAAVAEDAAGGMCEVPTRDHAPRTAQQHVKTIFQPSQLRAESVSLSLKMVHYNLLSEV